ncbi:hypothetical protein ZIOFF_025929 [Zingiber officinale]|uniref:FYVE-type domain-containing protein n=1 Tax=Zingiber officinale TaxID=94328 RepID=A0A8J5LEF4_ZINOF|nr:hypothetical protein ZIOFF_025929 [Zingiber officinale]
MVFVEDQALTFFRDMDPSSPPNPNPSSRFLFPSIYLRFSISARHLRLPDRFGFFSVTPKRMLEKIGLPAKPSMRGGSWVVDASHCQGCSSQFTFINRKVCSFDVFLYWKKQFSYKMGNEGNIPRQTFLQNGFLFLLLQHHCRRCGGIFCNNCTQQRMILRGQGDAPVRICDPCKKIEEAARFELRYGNKKRTSKVNTKQALHEDEILSQILGTDEKQQSQHEVDHVASLVLESVSGSSSFSSVGEISAASGKEADILRTASVDVHNHSTLDVSLGNPEELRQKAVEEKKRHKILKAEGKSEEALQAFKRGKELERQAGALEIAQRKNRRMASRAIHAVGIQKIDGHEESAVAPKLSSRRGRDAKDDLALELRELGWSDADVRESDKKSAKLSLEGELSNILAETIQRSSQGSKIGGGVDRSEVIALKKKALLLKREGKLAEAKEELKKAKILEKQIEEQELLGDAGDSDDELYALINSMDDDKQEELEIGHASRVEFGLNTFLSDDLPNDGNFQVTEDDMHDPEMAAALKSFGWSEEEEEPLAGKGEKSVAFDIQSMQNQVLSLKREALNQKRAGNVSEAMDLLKKAKLLEKDLESLQPSSAKLSSELKPESASPHVDAAAIQSVEKQNVDETLTSPFKPPPKSKIMIQKELLALKKAALSLRREGRMDEADETLKKGKFLEKQLEEMESAPKKLVEETTKGNIFEQQENLEIDPRRAVHKVGGKNMLNFTPLHEGDDRSLDLREELFENDVTEQDMHDPAMLSLLKNLGWSEDDNSESASMMNTTTKNMSKTNNAPLVSHPKPKRSKADIQRELLAIKRKSLALRRQGKTEEAEEELEKAKALESQIAEMEVPTNANFMTVDSDGSGVLIPQKISSREQASGDEQISFGSLVPSSTSKRISKYGSVQLVNDSDIDFAGSQTQTSIEKLSLTFDESPVGTHLHQSQQTKDMLQLLSNKGDETLHSLLGHPVKSNDTDVKVSPVKSDSEGVFKEKINNEESDSILISSFRSQEQKLAHGVDALKDEILSRKRKAVALKREGKLVEAREELRQAKLLEKNLEDSQQSISVQEEASRSTSDNTSIRKENKSSPSEKPPSGRDRFKIQQESLSHKRNALKLRREGKTDEAEAELELAKALEKQLEEFEQGSTAANVPDSMPQVTDDVVVEDLFDPQLMSALKAIGLQGTIATTSQPHKKTEPHASFDSSNRKQHQGKADLEEQIKAEKLQALNFKRQGKQAEALESLRVAKRLEIKLASLAQHSN